MMSPLALSEPKVKEVNWQNLGQKCQTLDLIDSQDGITGQLITTLMYRTGSEDISMKMMTSEAAKYQESSSRQGSSMSYKHFSAKFMEKTNTNTCKRLVKPEESF